MKDKLKSAIYGLAIGDALGVPYEFKKRGSFNTTDMIGYGTHNQPIGTWSDDTSMTLALCDSLRNNNLKIDTKDMLDRFRNWISNGKYTSNGVVFDYGNTTCEALELGYGIDDIYANGNGALMRVLPLAFCEVKAEDIDKVSAITHAHNISKEACRIYIHIAKELLKDKKLEHILKNIGVSSKFKRLKSLSNILEDEIYSTGYVVHTLEASLWCILKTNNYKEAVLKAVNLGDDTDTTAAVTGGLAGLIYGYNNIPKEWIDKLNNKELIEDCLFL